MSFLRFGPWAPDLSARDSQVLSTALNVVPHGTTQRLHYEPWPQWVALVTATLPSQCVGAFVALDASGAPVLFAGTSTKLYQFDRPNNQWDDVSRLAGGNYSASADERWSWAQFGAYLIAVNGNDAPQVIEVGVGANFAALAGSPPNCRGVTVVGNFVVLFNTITNPRFIAWSGLEEHVEWDPGDNFSDQNVVADGGPILGISDGRIPVVLQEEAVRTMVFVGGDAIFEFNKISEKRGLRSFSGYDRAADGYCYLMTEDGCFRTDGQGIMPVGHGMWSQTLMDDVEDSTRVQVVADENRPLLYIAYPSGTSLLFDKILIYNWEIDCASLVEQSGDFLLSLPSFGVTLDEDIDANDADLDSNEPSLDSRVYRGDNIVLGAIVAGQFGYITGNAAKEATLIGGDIEASPNGQRSFLTGVRPVVDTSTVYVSIAPKEFPWSATSFGSEQTPHAATGLCQFRSSGRYHRPKVRIPADTTWTRLEGLQPFAQPDGMR